MQAKFAKLSWIGVLCMLAVVGCSYDAGVESIPIDEMTLALEVTDYGAMHNAILSEMDVFGDGTNWSHGEFFRRLTDASDHAYAKHGPSRNFTVEEVARLVTAAAYEVEPLWDLSLKDPNRADPVAVLTHWLNRRMISQAEYTQLLPVFSSPDTRSGLLETQAAEAQPVSEFVRHTVSTWRASFNFWIGDRRAVLPSGETGGPVVQLGDEEPPNKGDYLRTLWGDAIGTATAALLGAGPFSPLVGAALSTAFHIQEGCIACPEGGGGTDGGGFQPPGPQP